MEQQVKYSKKEKEHNITDLQDVIKQINNIQQVLEENRDKK